MPKKLFKKGHSANVTHGHSRRGKHSPEYRCWMDIKTRCLNPTSKVFPYYGGRGIAICDRWANSFENFLADVGPRPTSKYTIDRYPDNDGDYEPGNVRWATRREQVDNRRNTIKISLSGEMLPLTEACRRLGLTRKLVATRLERGWTLSRALTPPLWRRSGEQR